MRRNYIIGKIKKIKTMMSSFINEELNIFQKFFILIDLAFCMVFYGAGITEYFQYEFYKKRHIARKNFIVHRKRVLIFNTCNNRKDAEIFDDKSKFNKTFKNFIGREWLDLSNCSFQDFCTFTTRHRKFIVKASKGRHGKGVYLQSIDEDSNLQNLFNKIKNEKAIIEELIIQDDELSKFNPSSVNTLRVVTLLCKDGEARVMTANLRVGRGDRIADNFHHQGIASLIDIETGIVKTTGIDGNAKRYILHPVTGKQIVGFKIPYWKEVKETVKKAAKVVPTMRYIGWDVAIGKEGKIILVEGNSAADPDVSQIPDQVGKWPLYEQYIKEIKLS